MPAASYDSDFYLWSQETAQALLEGRFSELDIEHIADEIRDLGTSQKNEVVRRLARVIAHVEESLSSG